MTSPSSLDALLAHLTGDDEEAAEQAALMIPEHGDTAVQALTGLFKSPKPETRWWAVRALAEFASDDLSGLFGQALADPDPEVRQCAALALRKNPYPGLSTDLAGLLASQDVFLAHLAADALIAIGVSAIPALIEAIDQHHPQARVEASRALSQIQAYDAVPTLFRLLDDDSALVAYWAEQGLEKLGIGMVFYHPS